MEMIKIDLDKWSGSKYCKIFEDDSDAQRVLKLIDFLYDEVKSMGGDGDALWYSKTYSVNDLLPIITKYNLALKFNWTIKHDELDIHIYNNQESILITNDENKFNNRPNWQQITIVW